VVVVVVVQPPLPLPSQSPLPLPTLSPIAIPSVVVVADVSANANVAIADLINFFGHILVI
jgi:hypothetical protein